MDDFNFFLPISKIEKQKDGSCIVSGYASTPSLDLDGEIVSLDAVKKALPGYWEWRNIREMHQPSAVGVGKEANVDQTGLFLRSHITDPVAAQKCIDEVYKGYSIGGRKLAKNGNTITEIDLIEISLVDRPANPDCRISIAKRAKDSTDGAYLLKSPKPRRDVSARAISKMAQAVDLMSKAGPPAARDGFSLPAPKFPEEQSSPKDPEVQNNKSSGACEEHGVVGCEDCMDKREVKEKERESLADQGKANPDGSFPIKNKEDLSNARRAIGRSKNPGKTRALIRTRARELGVKLPPKWKKKEARKLIKRTEKSQKTQKLLSLRSLLSLSSSSPVEPTPSFLALKGSPLEQSKESRARSPQASTFLEPLELTSRLGKDGNERRGVDLGDFSQDFPNFLSLSEDTMNPSAVSKGSTSDLDAAILNVIKRAAEPSRAKRMSMARGNLKKARQARRDAADSVKTCHASLSKRFMAKMSKNGRPGHKPGDEDDDDMAETEKVLKSLQKAYSALTTMKTFIKAADSHLAKAEARSGQRGQEVNDPASGVPTGKPAGLEDLSPGAMETAGGTSAPPMYPTDGSVYPGKFAKLADKNGMVSANVAELAAENARLEGQVALLGKVSNPGPRPYAFDVSKVYGVDQGSRGENHQRADVLLKGVDPQALNSSDENTRNVATATVAGNYLMSSQFGKSIVDPSFRGKAGVGRVGQ
jgi:hypothetical protein